MKISIDDPLKRFNDNEKEVELEAKSSKIIVTVEDNCILIRKVSGPGDKQITIQPIASNSIKVM